MPDLGAFCAEIRPPGQTLAVLGHPQEMAVRNGCTALAVDTLHRPIEIGEFRWSSSAGPWAGFPVECRVLGPRGSLDQYGIDHALIGLCVSGKGTLRVRDAGTVRRLQSLPGRFSLLASGFEQRPIAWSGMREMVYVALASEELERLMSHDPAAARLNVDPQFAISDPQVVSIVLNMRNEILAGCPAGRIYGEALSSALAAYLLARYSHQGAPVALRGLALSAQQIRRVREFVSANLERDIGLTELADQVGLSPHYFAMLFKQAFKVSPHRYVLSQRVHEAKRLLSDGRMAISEVALRLGFADQSHFSQVFRTFVGTTPKRYQYMC
jgi:AraC family transcriptional regulator